MIGGEAMEPKFYYLKKYFGHDTFREGQEQIVLPFVGQGRTRNYADGRRQINMLSNTGADIRRRDNSYFAACVVDERSGNLACAGRDTGGIFK